MRLGLGQHHQAGQPDKILIRRTLVVAGDAPGGDELTPVPNGKDGVGVAAVDGEKHGWFRVERSEPGGFTPPDPRGIFMNR